MSVVVAKELHHALDFRRRLPTVRRRLPTVVFHSFIASASGSRAVTERLLKPPKDGGDRPSWSCTLNGVSRFGFHRRQKSCQLQLALIRRESDPPREKRLEVTKYICRALQRRIEIGNAFSSGPPLRRSSRFQPGSRSQTHDSIVSFIFLSSPR